MPPLLDGLWPVMRLGVPVLVGLLAGWAGLFAEPRRAVTSLNTYALHVAFPVLVALGLLDASYALPSRPAFYALWPVVLALSLLGVHLLGGRERGTLALVAAFGNVAYLGLPLTVAVLGHEITGPATLALAVHVCLAVSVGPLLLRRWSERGAEDRRVALGRVLRLPLFWAPILGLLGRLMPLELRAGAGTWLGPIGGSAAPVALFLLGLYLHVERERLTWPGHALLAHVGLRLVLIPALTLGLGLVGARAGWLDLAQVRVHVLLAAVPAAITTFSIAHDAEVGAERVAEAVVWSTVLGAISLPLWSLLMTRGI